MAHLEIQARGDLTVHTITHETAELCQGTLSSIVPYHFPDKAFQTR